MTNNDQSKTIVFVDGNYIDKTRLQARLSINLEKLKKYISDQFDNCEFRYFNTNSTQDHFIEIVKNLGFSVSINHLTESKVGTAIGTELDRIAKNTSNIIVVGGTNAGYLKQIVKLSNKDDYKVFVYYFENRLAQNSLGSLVHFVRMNGLKTELGITNTPAEKKPQTEPIQQTKFIKPVADTLKTPLPAIIIFDGSSLDQMLAISNKTIDYTRFIEYIARTNQPCQLRYINKVGTDKTLTHLIGHTGCNIKVEANTDKAIGNEISNILKHNKNKTDHFIIVGGYNPEYIEEAKIIASNPDKKMTIYSFGELVNPEYMSSGIDFKDLADYKKDAGIYEKETIVFIDGKGVEDWKKSIDIWLDYNELTELVKKDLKFYELRYFIDTNGNENITKKYQNLGYNIDIPSTETGSYEDRIKFQFEIAIKRPNIDNAIIVCGETPNYITDITDLSASLNKSVKFFSIKNLIEKNPEHKIVKAKPVNEKIDHLNNLIADATKTLTTTGENDPIKIETPDPGETICEKSDNAQKLFDTINEMLLDGTLPEIKATIKTNRDIQIEMASTKK